MVLKPPTTSTGTAVFAYWFLQTVQMLTILPGGDPTVVGSCRMQRIQQPHGCTDQSDTVRQGDEALQNSCSLDRPQGPQRPFQVPLNLQGFGEILMYDHIW